MKLNTDTVLHNATVELVPYTAAHVPQYHAWMQDSEVLELTASEPLSLEEEYAMQRSWQEDADKLTFIILRTSTDGADPLSRMVGDVNLFLSEHDDDNNEEKGTQPEASETRCFIGELEIMIAAKSAQRQGYGRAAILLFMAYILKHQGKIAGDGNLTALRVKIGKDNIKSLALFEGIGFKRHKYVEVFGEYELRMPIHAESTRDTLELMRDRDRQWKEDQMR